MGGMYVTFCKTDDLVLSNVEGLFNINPDIVLYKN